MLSDNVESTLKKYWGSNLFFFRSSILQAESKKDHEEVKFYLVSFLATS